MKKDKKDGLFRIFSVYSSLILLLFIATIANINKQKPINVSAPIDTLSETSTIADACQEINSDSAITAIVSTEVLADGATSPKKYYLVKAHGQMIGVFDAEGTLVDTINVYIKTLPSKDQDLLREGFEIYSDEELEAIVEDYTG